MSDKKQDSPLQLARVTEPSKPATNDNVCSAALVLLMDESGSIGEDNWRLQVDGTAKAIGSSDVAAVIVKSKGIAVTVMPFSGEPRQAIKWTILRTDKDIQKFTNRLAALADEYRQGNTNIPGALDAAFTALEKPPCTPDRLIVDIATDGESNDITSPLSDEEAKNAPRNAPHYESDERMLAKVTDPKAIAATQKMRAKAMERGITINGIGISVASQNMPAISLRENVITKDGQVFEVNDWKDFAEAIKNKVFMEVAGGPMPKTFALADESPNHGLPEKKAAPTQLAAVHCNF